MNDQVRRNFLIVDDDKNSRRILALMLKEFGDSTNAESGEEALAEVSTSLLPDSSTFDVIFLDNVLPGKQGLDVLRDIRSAEESAQIPQHKKVPVIMLTGKADVDTIDDAKLLGVSAYILKPVEEQKLLRELQRLRLIPDPDDQWG